MKKILTVFMLCAGLSTCVISNAAEHKTVKQASVKAVKKAPAKPAAKEKSDAASAAAEKETEVAQ